VKGVAPNKAFIFLLPLSLCVGYGMKQHTADLSHFADLLIGVVLCGLTVLPVLYSYKREITAFVRKSKEKEKESAKLQ
jgi:hypothetical protein